MSRVTDARYRALLDADARRNQLQLTYRDVAKLGPLPERSVGSYMRGEVWPNGPSIGRLEHAIGWPPGELRRRELRYSQAPRRGMRWVTDTVYRLRIANMILRSGVKPEDRPGGVPALYVEATMDADPEVPFDQVTRILEGLGIDIGDLDTDGPKP